MFKPDSRVREAILLKESTGISVNIALNPGETFAAYVFHNNKGSHTCTYTDTIDDLFYITTHDHGFKNKVIEYGVETRVTFDS